MLGGSGLRILGIGSKGGKGNFFVSFTKYNPKHLKPQKP